MTTFFEDPQIVDKYRNYSFKSFVYYTKLNDFSGVDADSKGILHRLSLRVYHPRLKQLLINAWTVVQTESLESLQIWCDLHDIDFSNVLDESSF